MERTEWRGRPRIERDPNERVPMSARVRGELFNRLSEAARVNNRPLANEVELRLEQSFEYSVASAGTYVGEELTPITESIEALERRVRALELAQGPQP